MGKGRQVEIGAELAIDPGEQVQVERGALASGIVVGGPDDRFVFIEVETDQEPAAGADQVGDFS